MPVAAFSTVKWFTADVIVVNLSSAFPLVSLICAILGVVIVGEVVNATTVPEPDVEYVVPQEEPPDTVAIPEPNGYVIGALLLNVPVLNNNPVLTVTLLNPPEPFPYKIEVPEVAGA